MAMKLIKAIWHSWFGLLLALALMVGGFALMAHGLAHASTQRPSVCNIGGIDVTSHRLLPTKRKQRDQKAYMTGVVHFQVICAPQKGEFDLRLQVWSEHERDWISKDVVKKDVSKPNTHDGEKFAMNVRAECAGPKQTSKLSWRLRLFAAPGIASDGTPTGPGREFFPSQKGKQIACPLKVIRR